MLTDDFHNCCCRPNISHKRDVVKLFRANEICPSEIQLVFTTTAHCPICMFTIHSVGSTESEANDRCLTTWNKDIDHAHSPR